MRDTQKKRVFIIGATSAIAVQVARHYAARQARIVLAGRHPDRTAAVQADLMARGAGGVRCILGDLSDRSLHHRFCDEALSAFGGLDVVLLAYGTLGDQARATSDPDEAETILRVNLNSPVSWLTILAQRLSAQLPSSPDHAAPVTVAAIGSVAGDRGRKSNYVYGAAKGGLDRFLQGLRNRHHGSHLRIVTIKPGFVDTPMTSEFKKGPLFASAEQVGESIYKSLEQPNWYTTLSGDVIYVPWFWRGIMCIIQHIPEVIFRRMSI